MFLSLRVKDGYLNVCNLNPNVVGTYRWEGLFTGNNDTIKNSMSYLVKMVVCRKYSLTLTICCFGQC